MKILKGIAAVLLILMLATVSLNLIILNLPVNNAPQRSQSKVQYAASEKNLPKIIGWSSESQLVNCRNITPLESILSNNAKKLSNISEYDGEIISDYISINKDIGARKKVMSEITSLSETICDNADNDYDKCIAIADWVSDNISYDFDAAHNSVDLNVICLENVLSRRRTTCAGYSNLFSALCSVQGIYCINLRGGTAADGITPARLEEAPINHEWNACLINNKWIFIDTTWASNNAYQNGTFSISDGRTDFYIDFSFEEMSAEHRIDIAEHRDFTTILNY